MRMIFNDEIRALQEAQGWSDSTLLKLLIEFIGNEGIEPDCVEFLEEIQEDENAEYLFNEDLDDD